MIDATLQFGKKFMRDQEGKTPEETEERLRAMGSTFTKNVGKAINHLKREREESND